MGVVTPEILYLPEHDQHWYLHNTDMECTGLKIIATEHFHQNMVGTKNLTSLTVKCNKRYKKIINLSFYQCFNLFPASLSLNVSKIWADGFKLINIIEVSYLHNHLSTRNIHWTNIWIKPRSCTYTPFTSKNFFTPLVIYQNFKHAHILTILNKNCSWKMQKILKIISTKKITEANYSLKNKSYLLSKVDVIIMRTSRSLLDIHIVDIV